MKIKKGKKVWKNEKGFSLIELLIVIGILSILAVIIIPRFTTSSEDAKIAADAANTKLLQSAVERYYFDNGEYPTSDGDPNKVIDQSKLIDGKYISEKAVSPWDGGSSDYADDEYELDENGIVKAIHPDNRSTD